MKVLASIRQRIAKIAKEVRGNAFWDLIKWSVGSSGLLGFLASFFAGLRQAPLPVFIGIAIGVIILASGLIILAFIKTRRKPDTRMLRIRLDYISEKTLKKHAHRLEVENIRDTAIHNLNAKLFSIRPSPPQFEGVTFPIELKPDSKDDTTNPRSKRYFDFVRIDVGPAQRLVSLNGDDGKTIEFKVELYEMLGKAKEGYICEVRISASEISERKVLCKLRLEPQPDDAFGATCIMGGYRLEFTSEEEETLAKQTFVDSLFRDRHSITV